MPALRTLIFALFLLPLTMARAADDPHAEDRKELLKVFREIEAAINAQSVDRMVMQMAPDATVTWLNGEVSRGHEEIKAYYNRMVRGEKRILDKYVTAAKLGAPAKFYGNGEVAVADGSTEDHPQGTGFVHAPGDVHIAGNEGTTPLELFVMFITPEGENPRIDEPQP